jgi:hypothetical protein
LSSNIPWNPNNLSWETREQVLVNQQIGWRPHGENWIQWMLTQSHHRRNSLSDTIEHIKLYPRNIKKLFVIGHYFDC